jgi:methyl-accepting chemotaxis protein
MRWFFNLKITYKLLIGFMTVAVIAAIIGIGGIINIKKITNAGTQLYEDNLVGLKYAGEAVIEFQEVRANTFKLLLTTDENERSKYVKKIDEHITATDNQLKSYEARISNDEDKKLYSRVKNLWESFKSLLQDITNLVESGNNEEAQELMLEKSDTVIDTLNDMFSKLFEYNTSAAEEKANNNSSASIVANTIMSIIVLIGVLIAIFLGIIISRIISKPIKKLEEAAEQLAVGDINVKIETKSKDEIGKLMLAFSKMVDNK